MKIEREGENIFYSRQHRNDVGQWANATQREFIGPDRTVGRAKT